MNQPDKEKTFRMLAAKYLERTSPQPGVTVPEDTDQQIDELVDSVLEPSWDSTSRKIPIHGEVTECFTIFALAQALERSVGVMRRWESLGYLPKAPYRQVSTTVNGRHRVYTRAHIEGLIKIASEEGLLGPRQKKTQVSTTRFPERARELFTELKQARS